MNHNPTPMKAKFLPLFNVNLSQLNLNSVSTKLWLNLISTSFQPQVQINLSLNINLNSTSTLTSTQNGSDIKATQSCCHTFITFYCNKIFYFICIRSDCRLQLLINWSEERKSSNKYRRNNNLDQNAKQFIQANQFVTAINKNDL